jgi:hypothetical protein
MALKKYKWIKKDLDFINKMNRFNGTEKRKKRFIKQYEKQGWCDAETWSLDNQFAKWITPRLKRFKQLTNGIPMDLTEKQWDNILQEMIDGFEFMASDDYYEYGNHIWREKHEKINKAMDLFTKHIRNLWW